MSFSKQTIFILILLVILITANKWKATDWHIHPSLIHFIHHHWGLFHMVTTTRKFQRTRRSRNQKIKVNGFGLYECQACDKGFWGKKSEFRIQESRGANEALPIGVRCNSSNLNKHDRTEPYGCSNCYKDFWRQKGVRGEDTITRLVISASLYRQLALESIFYSFLPTPKFCCVKCANKYIWAHFKIHAKSPF